MISNMTGYAIARHFRPTPIYEALLEQDGIHLPHRGGRVSHALERLRVGSAMTKNPVTIPATATVLEAIERIGDYGHSTYPVVAEQNHFIGLVTGARLRRTAAARGKNKSVQQLVDSCPHVRPEYPLVRAAVRRPVRVASACGAG